MPCELSEATSLLIHQHDSLAMRAARTCLFCHYRAAFVAVL